MKDKIRILLTLASRKIELTILEKASKQAFIQVMVAFAVGFTVVMSMTASRLFVNRESRALEQKIASMDLDSKVSGFLSFSKNCSLMIAENNTPDPSAWTLPAQIPASQPYIIPLYSISDIVMSKGALDSSGKPAPGIASPLSDSLFVLPATAAGASLPGIMLAVSGANPYSATLSIHFDSSKQVQPIRSLSFPGILLQTDSHLKLTGCSASGPGKTGMQLLTASGFFTTPSDTQSSPQFNFTLFGGGRSSGWTTDSGGAATSAGAFGGGFLGGGGLKAPSGVAAPGVTFIEGH